MRLGSLFFVAALVAACGGRTQLGGVVSKDAAADGVAPQTTNAIFKRDCAPNDGPAYSFVIASPAPSCTSPSVGAGTVLVTIWGPFPTGPGTYGIGNGGVQSGSSAFACTTGPGDCTQATHGTLVLTDFSPPSGGASGSVTLVMPDQTTVSVSFDALYCNDPPMCG